MGKSGSSTWSLIRLVLAHPGRAVAIALCSLVVGFLGWSVALFVQHVLDHTSNPGWLTLIAGGMAILALLRGVVLLVRHVLQQGLSLRIERDLASGYLEHLLNLEMPAYDLHKSGDLLSRLRGLDYVRFFLQDRILGLVFDAVLFVVAAGILLSYSVPLTLLAIAGALVPALVVRASGRKLDKTFERTQEADGRFMHDCMDALKGVRDLRVAEATPWFLRRLRDGHRAVQEGRARYMFGRTVVGAGTGVFSTLTSILVLLVGAGTVASGRLSPGELMFLFTMSGMLLGPLEQLASLSFVFGEAKTALGKAQEILDLRSEPRLPAAPLGELRGEIRFENVRFGYRPDRPVLKGIDFTIPAGSCVAIVGESGAGKSTFLSLLAGLYAPDGGRIRIDGRDLREIPLDSWRSRLGVVFPGAHLFEATVEENLRLGEATVTAAEVRRAARLACAEEFILNLPQGYATPVPRDGATFSTGQAQRLILARALVRDPKILLLDEATHNLDVHTEAAVWLALSDKAAGRTTLFVSHRLSSTVQADQILVLDEGRIAEAGTFEELMHLRGLYYRLWRRQVPIGFEPAESKGWPVRIRT